MNEILHANIFFVIASVATVVFSIFICLALYQIIKILQVTRLILERIESGSEVLASDIANIRMFFAKGSLFSSLFGLFANKPRASKKSRKKKGEQEQTED